MELRRLTRDGSITTQSLNLLPVVSDSQQLVAGAIDGFDLEGLVARWIRGFHAALYRERLGNVLRGCIWPPLASSDSLKPDQAQFDVSQQRLDVCHGLYWQRKSQRVDQLLANQNTVEYICYWSRVLDGFRCYWALRIDDWIEWGDLGQPKRACVGFFDRLNAPSTASRLSSLHVPRFIPQPLDPFAD